MILVNQVGLIMTLGSRGRGVYRGLVQNTLGKVNWFMGLLNRRKLLIDLY